MLAVLLGAYKTMDEHGEEIGFAETAHRGCGVLIFKDTGTIQHFRDIEEGAEFLGYLRQKAKLT